MFTIYTTKDNLFQLCLEKDNSWHKIIMKMKKVVVCMDNDEEWNLENKILQNLHKAQVHYSVNNDFINQIVTQKPQNVLEDPCAAYLLDVADDKANSIQSTYGVICQSHNNKGNVLTEKGWTIHTEDPTKRQSWNSFFSNHKCPLNSLIIIDRYFFSSEPEETLDDSFYNLEQLLDSLLPTNSLQNIQQVIIIFDFNTFNFKKDKREDGADYTFKAFAEKINGIKHKVRKYSYDLELLSINSDCYKYEDTHDRRIIANYNITEAGHKLKAFRANNTITCGQNLTFKRLFEEGLDFGDKSTLPAFSQKNTIKKIQESIEISKTTMKYAYNGRVVEDGNFEIKNRLLLKKG